jgi:hypothetical protein
VHHEVKNADDIQQLARAWEGSANIAHTALLDAIREHQIDCANFEKEKVWILQFLTEGNTPDPEVVHIDLLGHRVCTRRSTLMLCTESALARQFDSAAWVQNPGRGAGKGTVDDESNSDSDSDSDADADVIYLKQVGPVNSAALHSAALVPCCVASD